MDNLLDTHTFIWFVEGDEQLSSRSKEEIEKSGTINYISIASIWEIAIKISIDKLELKKPFKEINSIINLNGFEILPISFFDTVTIAELPFFNRDPFDRMIAAQAITNNLRVISKDSIFRDYNVSLVW